MSVASLIEFFSTFRKLPVQIDDVRDQIVHLGIQDEIVFRPDPEMNQDILHGVFYRYRKYNGVYQLAKNCTLIVYNANLTQDWQRLVCCKELMHLCDPPTFRTDTPDHVVGLAKHLLEAQIHSIPRRTDLMALKDRLAVYEALAILLPEEARDELKPYYDRGQLTIDQIAQFACLPQEMVGLVMHDGWTDVLDEFLGRS